MKKVFYLIFTLSIAFSAGCDFGGKDDPKSSQNNITGFVLSEQTGPAVIDTAAYTVTIEVASGSGLTSLTPTITVSVGASVSPASGTAVDFSTVPVTYTVTAENGTARDWAVTVTEALAACSISNFVTNESVGYVGGYVGTERTWGDDFKTWLENNGYSDIASSRGWGGYIDNTCTVTKTPVIFIHGNGGTAYSFGIDGAVNTGTSIRTYMINTGGYKSCELFAIQWQPDRTQVSSSENHYKGSRLAWIRHFINAVLEYTGSSKVNVVGWSMGVNAGRKSITGGTAYEDPDRQIACDLGTSIKESVNSFVGLAGASTGVSSCGTWGVDNETWNSCGANGMSIDSPFMVELNGGTIGNVSNPHPVADYVYSLISGSDGYMCDEDTTVGNDRMFEVDGTDIPTCTINGVHISEIPGSTAVKDVDSILDWFDVNNDYNSTTNRWVDHVSMPFETRSHDLIYYLLNSSPTQAEVDTFYGGL